VIMLNPESKLGTHVSGRESKGSSFHVSGTPKRDFRIEPDDEIIVIAEVRRCLGRAVYRVAHPFANTPTQLFIE